MEVVAAPPPTGGTPFRDHDVREWSRINSITGALERARLETDSWSASNNEGSHRYGKVVDSRARTGADGALETQASRQLEVFQSRAAGARLQVVKTKTVSSSRWSGKGEGPKIKELGFENLVLPYNPLDLTSQKSKVSVGRSVNRRPPSRHPKPPTSSSNFTSDLRDHIRSAHFTAATNLHRVSRLCHQIHESAVRNAFGRASPTSSCAEDNSISGVEITEIESSVTSNSDANTHVSLSRTKSNSSDNIQQIPEKESSVKSVEDLQDLEQLQNWRRNSKVRRSLQFPKVSSPTVEKNPIIDLPESTVNVKKLRDELEKGRRLTAALRNNSISSDLNALDNIIQSISSASSLERSSIDDNLDDLGETEQLISNRKKKRESFVTVESIQEVKGRLRRTSSPGSDIYCNGIKSKEDESADDGIVTEDPSNKVKSYIYGMENMLNNKKSIIGTGSLESRSKFVNGSNNHKNEDWYNRRKSYGFEKVHSPDEPTSMSLKGKNLVESSTDSGICRSSEIMVVPPATKRTHNTTNGDICSDDSGSDVENKKNSFNTSLNGIHYGNVKKMTSIFSQEDKNPYLNRSSDELTKAWNKRSTTFKENDWNENEIKSTTITIPIVKNNNVVDLSWNDVPEREGKNDRYATNNESDNDRFRKTSFDQVLKNDLTDDDNLNNNRKGKKVEFCKTEVHFAAESGKVNIVATDEKPPPTQNFRRRRRNSGPTLNYPEDFNKNGLPMLHFGDSSYEKTMFGISNDEETENKITPSGIFDGIPSAFSVVTVNNTNKDFINNVEYSEEDRRELLDNDNLKGILKNKPIKPKPYHLGETTALNDTEEDARRWGVRLRHVPKDTVPIWKSTVTVQNTYQNNEDREQESTSDQKPEFQKLLRNLRPAMKKTDYLSDNENRYTDSFAKIRVIPSAKDNRRSSWSVADMVKLVDEIQENRGYSTKVNFGNGEATVVQNDQSTWPRTENLTKDDPHELHQRSNINRINATHNKYVIHPNTSKSSPIVLRRAVPISTTESKELKTKNLPHSPTLAYRKIESSTVSNTRQSQSPPREFRNLPDSSLQAKYLNESIVLRQPKKSEMTYFGVDIKPKVPKESAQITVIKKGQKELLHKPDLLQHHKRSPSPSNKINKLRKPTPESDRKLAGDSPIYENLRHIGKGAKSKYTNSKEFDSSILDELTKAADQILQAVNGYTSEDCQNRLSSEEEEPKKPLDTISETKSWKHQEIELKNQQRMRPTLASAAKMKVKRTSSNSSLESLSKCRNKQTTTSSTERRTSITAQVSKSVGESSKKRLTNDTGTTKSSTKARRLQRASSREALLQSHGSSSEDLPSNVEVPVRKPRLIKKTKATQLTVTSGIELKKPVRKSREEKADSGKSDSRIMGSLPEIRHKTAVSTITSTAEQCSRDRSKTRIDESKSKIHSKRESSSKGTVSSSSTRPSTSRQHHAHQSQRTTSSSKESGMTQHRISTANIKRCHRSESATRH